MIEIRNLKFKYNQNNVLKAIDMTLETGSLTALIGLNGAGKSTLFRCLMRLENIDRGMIIIDGKDINDMTVKDISKKIAFVPQLNNILKSDIIVKDYIVEGRTPYLKLFSLPTKKDYIKVEECACKLGIGSLLNRPLNTLSGGESQLVVIARALIQETELIILDEPTSALDIINQSKVLALLKKLNQEGKSILYSTHDPNHALFISSNICFMKDGYIIASGPAQDVINNQNLSLIYGNSIKVLNNGNEKFCSLYVENL